VLLGAVVTVGAVTFHLLQSKTQDEVFDTDPGHAWHRIGIGAHEIVGYVVPLLAHWFPWWPLTLLALVLAVALPQARRTLLSLKDSWYWLPLLAAPVVFLAAYHLLNPFPFEIRHYRARFAYFFAPPLAVLVAVVGHAVGRAVGDLAAGTGDRMRAWAGPALVGVLLLSQVPTTVQVVARNDVPDFGQAGDVLRAEVPADALVLYDSPAPLGYWRQPFSGRDRYLAGAPTVVTVTSLAKRNADLETDGPVYLLLLDSECATSVVCDMPHRVWRQQQVPGYEVVRRFDRFTLYAPTEGQRGRSGVMRALPALRTAYGFRWAGDDVGAQARLMRRAGDRPAARHLVRDYCSLFRGHRETACLRTVGH
jgi:hypothetical protein